MLQEASKGYISQGLVRMEQNHITTALDAFLNAAMLEESVRILNLCGLCCYRLGLFNHAGTYWERSLSFSQDSNPARGYLSDLNSPQIFTLRENYRCTLDLMIKKNYKSAARLLKQSGGIECFVSFANLMGLCCYAMKKPKKALRYFLKALALDKDNPVTRRCLCSMGGAVCAKKACRQIVNTLLEA